MAAAMGCRVVGLVAAAVVCAATVGRGGDGERPGTGSFPGERAIPASGPGGKGVSASRAAGRGIAARYPGDRGIEKDPAVLLALSFDDAKATKAWYGKRPGYGWTGRPGTVYSGGGALEVRQVKGTHTPMEIHPTLPAGHVAYVRWYRKWDEGYDWTQHKMSGVYAWAGRPRGGGAGRRPNGRDKFSCKLYVDFAGRPRFYTYHPEQRGGYGDGLLPNLFRDVRDVPRVRTGRWYCFEMMIKANDAPKRNGELKMWLDGRLIGHYRGMRFRDTNELKINQFTYSAYVGGTWVSRRDQRLWDDQIVVAREYIGPMAPPSPTSPASGGG